MKHIFDTAVFRSWLPGFNYPLTCSQVGRLLPGYLDDALPESLGPRGRLRIARHLEECGNCRCELQRYRAMSHMISGIRPSAPPQDLGVAIRVAISKARGQESLAARVRRWKDRAELVLENILEPLALPATGGLLVALIGFTVFYQILGTAPLGATTPDSPTNLLQPARLEVLAGFEMAGLEDITRTGGQHPLMVEATVNADGQAVGYRIISGEVNAAVHRQLDQVILFSRFRPQMSFGRPTSGGHVILSFTQIRVQG